MLLRWDVRVAVAAMLARGSCEEMLRGVAAERRERCAVLQALRESDAIADYYRNGYAIREGRYKNLR